LCVQSDVVTDRTGIDTGVTAVGFERRIIDFAARTYIDVDGREWSLTRAECALISAFLRNPARVLSRDQLRCAVCGGSAEPNSRSIDMLVTRLRRKIEVDPAEPRLVLTVPSEGYRFAVRPQDIKWLTSGTGEVQHAQATSPARLPPERRQLVVMACEIAGFAELSTRLDLDDLCHTTNVIHSTCANVLRSFGGKVAQFLADHLVIYFGHQKAQEDDAQRAILAGFALLRAVADLRVQFYADLHLRVGIASGPVMIAGLSGTDESDGFSAVGLPLTVAMQLQSAAQPGTIIVAAETRDLAGRLFQYEELPHVVANEGMTPVSAWRVTKQSDVAGRFDALHRSPMTELVGRSAQVDLLKRNWSQTCSGEGRVVLLSGEAGIGKSRLAMTLAEQIEGGTILRYFGFPYGTDAPLLAVIKELEKAAGFTSDDSPEEKLAKLKAHFEPCESQHADGINCIAHLLALPIASGSVAQLSPRTRKEKIFATLLARIDSLATCKPVLVLIEDAQWIDSMSLEFIAALVQRASRRRIMALVTAQSEFTPVWATLPHVKVFELSRLGHNDAEYLVSLVAGANALPRDITTDILTRADGVPLFLEEITKSVLESGDLRHHPAVPSTLRAALLARLDRLGPAKKIVQIGAVIGREFSYKLLRLVAVAAPETKLSAALEHLVRSRLAFRRGVGPHATYIFKHALVRDAAYDTLPRELRQTLHAAIAEALEEHFPEIANSEPALLAHHFREGGNTMKTAIYLTATAERALLGSGTAEAFTHLADAQGLLSSLPEGKERSQLELKLEIILSRAFTALRSFAAPETREAYRRVRARCETLDDQSLLPMVMLGQWVGAWSAAEHDVAISVARELYSFGERHSVPEALAAAHMAMGISLTVCGDLVRGRGHFEDALRINRFTLPLRQPFLFSDADGRVSSATYLHDCLLLLGYPTQAESAAKQAEAAANGAGTPASGQTYSCALAQHHILRMYVLRRDIQKTMTNGSALLHLAREQGYPYFLGSSMIHVGWALAHSGETERGIDLCRQGLTRLRQIGVSSWFPRYFALLGECYKLAGNKNRENQTLTDALQSLDSTGERLWESEIYRLKGCFLLRAGEAHKAEACFVKAVSTARQRHARLFELRAATNLAGLMTKDSNGAKARDVLSSIYGRFTEGFDQVDLREAKAVLDRLPAA
jgi:class 3 adenylate cyclase/predicted ATPase